MTGKSIFAALALVLVPSAIAAHHSFSAFFDADNLVKITGKVTHFRFTNPHGTIGLDVLGRDGAIHKWRVETNAPVVLMRRGWSRNSIQPGQSVTVEGWRARDGKPYLRLREATDTDGRVIGTAPFGRNDG